MQSTVTVSLRSVVLALVAALALVLAYLLGTAASGGTQSAVAAPAAQAQAIGDMPSIVATGTGTVTGVPDQLAFGVGVNRTAADVSTALRLANASTRSVLRALEEQGVPREDVQTTGLDIDVRYDYGEYGPPTIIGYAASQRLSVLVQDLPAAGEAIGAVAEAGGNAIRLNDVRLQIGDRDGLVRKARAAAIEEAQAKAAQYAAATGSELGAVLSIQEGSPKGGGRMVAESLSYAAARDMASTVPVRAGSEELDVTVSVAYALG